MKEIGKEKKIAIAALIVAVLMLTVAFAAMSRTLKINGTAKVDSAAWDIHFKSAEMIDKKGDAREVVEPEISEDGIDLTLKVGLRKPKDEITYEAIIENSGDIDAEIEGIEYPNLTEDQAKIIEFEATYADGSEISKSQELKATEGKTVKIVIRYKDITDESLLATEVYDIPLTFKINYIQKGFATQSTPEGGDIVEGDSSPYKVTNDGILVYYERQEGETSVTVPAEVNGIKIKAIAPYAFVDNADFILAANSDETSYYVICLKEDLEEKGIEIANSMGFEFVSFEQFKNEYSSIVNIMDIGKEYALINQYGLETQEIVSKNPSNLYLKNIDLSNMIYLEEIGVGAFYGYEGDGEEECGESGSCSLGKLETVLFPQNGVLTTIGTAAFSTNQLTTISFPSTLRTIDDSAFNNNKLTGELIIPINVVELGNRIFYGNNLTKVTIEGDLSRFGSSFNPLDVFDSNVTIN